MCVNCEDIIVIFAKQKLAGTGIFLRLHGEMSLGIPKLVNIKEESKTLGLLFVLATAAWLLLIFHVSSTLPRRDL